MRGSAPGPRTAPPMPQLSDGLPLSLAPAPAPDAAPAAACLNCGAALVGEFCHACGQSAAVARLDLRQLRDDFVRHSLSLDRGLLLTARELTTDPGGMLRRYLAGQRRRYASPVTYLFVGTALSLLALEVYEKRLDAWTREAMALAMERNPGLLTPAQAAAYSEILLVFGKQMTVSTLATVLPFALILRWLFRRDGLNAAEAGVFTLYVFGHALAIHSLLTPLLLLGAGEKAWQLYVGVVGTLFLLLVCGHAGYRLFGRWAAALKATAALLLAGVLTMALTAALAMTYVLLAR